MEQEHRITYKAGITRTPSDFLCQDGELAECINLTTDNEELKPMVQPAEYITSAQGLDGNAMEVPSFLYIHKFNNKERYIGYSQSSIEGTVVYPMIWGIKEGNVFKQKGTLGQSGGSLYYNNGLKITSVGKTLIISHTNGMLYYLWKEITANNQYYNFLGSMIPSPEFEFALLQEQGYTVENSGSGDLLDVSSSSVTIEKGHQEDYNDTIVGLYSKNKKAILQKKCFCEPFLIRTAVRLFDGTYTHISAPQVLLPALTNNTLPNKTTITDKGPDEIQLSTRYCKLLYKHNSNFAGWEDIVKDVTVFVSRSINIYDTNVDQVYTSLHSGDTEYDGVFRNAINGISEYRKVTATQLSISVQVLKKRDRKEIVNDISSTSLFYKLAELGTSGDSSFHDIGDRIDTHTLENITTQERLENDDYYSYAKLNCDYMYSYNSRLNISGVQRGFFEGFGSFMPFDQSVSHNYKFFVTIETDSGNFTVMHEENTKQKQGIYFYYPDARAKHVTIFKDGTTKILDVNLKEHPGLNGAYYFSGLPGVDKDEPTGTTGTQPSYNNDAVELLPNYIITSEVNNPFVFKAEGYNRVGTGKIIAISTITQALSEGQFGQYPLLVFSESGIWAMSVNNTGLYQSTYPMSREVCINTASILQTDGAVFFVSKKGLMVISGNEVRCVSEQMNGVPFNTDNLSTTTPATPLGVDTPWADIISACRNDYSESFLNYVRSSALLMAYDYIDSRIIMTNPNKGYSFVYNIADGTISKTVLPAAMNNAVNNYPDYLLQGTFTETVELEGQEPQTVTHNYIYSFYEKPLEVNVAKRSLAFLLTRPMKLAGPVSQASLRQLMNVGMWDEGTALSQWSKVKTEIYVSSDMKTWYSDVSRFGAAARYFRLALYIKMLPTERLSGTILTTQERRGNNMRA